MNRGFWNTTLIQNARGVAQCKLSPFQASEKEKIENKVDALCFFSQGIFLRQFVPPGRTVNQTVYREVLETQEKFGTCATRHCTHLDDNAPCHTSVSINEFLAEKSIPVVSQPPIHGISVPVTSFCSIGSKTIWYLA
jgi:hypothetical protein